MPNAPFRKAILRTQQIRWSRVVLGLIVAVYAASLAYAPYVGADEHHSDFSLSWFGAKAMMEGRDPYPRLGPGLEFDFPFRLLYPATAFVVALPFAAISNEGIATAAFVALSSFALALGVTRGGWHLVPMFATDAFRSSAASGQWTILLTAAVYYPALALLGAAKPQAALPVLAGSRGKVTLLYGIAGALALFLISLIILPGWPAAWILLVIGSETQHMLSPIFHPFGFHVLAVLWKWRQPEAWMILALAFVPQTMYWYNCLILFTIPKDFRESIFLAAVGGIGMIASGLLAPDFTSQAALYKWVGGSVVLSFYLPAVLLVLRSPARIATIPEAPRMMLQFSSKD